MNESQEDGNEAALAAVLVASEELPEGSIAIRGYDFNGGRELDGLLRSFKSTGLQATALGRAIDEVNAMLDWRVDPGELAVEGAVLVAAIDVFLVPPPPLSAALQCK